MKMTTSARVALSALLLPVVAQAHPGHDGHELVWEFSGSHFHLEPLLWVLAAAAGCVVFYRWVIKRC